jgi:hypothetical protein
MKSRLAMQYWMIVASKDHFPRVMSGTFFQANHSQAAPPLRDAKNSGAGFSADCSEDGGSSGAIG